MKRLQRPHATGIAAMAVAAGISAWLLVQHEDSPGLAAPGPATTAAATTGSELPQGPVTEAELRAAAARRGQPLYWVGARRGRKYELGEDQSSGAVGFRYLTPAGDVELAVTTIPLADAFAKTKKLAARATSVSHRLAGGGIAWSSQARPLTAYVAQPGVEYVAEVDAQQPGLARRLAFAGRVEPVVG